MLKRDGCCAASRWEILREVLTLDSTMRELAVAKYKRELRKGAAGTGGAAGTAGTAGADNIGLKESLRNKLVLQRSTSWIETVCQVTLDRGCSRGLRRSLIALHLTLEGLNYERIFKNSLSSRSSASPAADLVTDYSASASDLLIKSLRSSISDVLAIPVADVGEMRFWQGSVSAEVVIDGGASTAEILRVNSE